MDTLGPPPLAAWLDSYRADLKSALNAAARDGFTRVGANSAAGSLDPREFSRSAQRDFSRYLRNLGLSLDALGAEFGGAGLADPQRGEQRLTQLAQTLALARAVGAPRSVVTIRGFADERRADLAHEMLQHAADLATQHDVQLAIAADPADLAPLADRLRTLNCPHLGVRLESAETPEPGPLAALNNVGVAAVHLHDVVRRGGAQVEEVPFGSGDVDFAGLLGWLAETEYRGSLTLRQDATTPRVDALRVGREYVTALLAGRAR